jgi:glycosyltransferase involved in cell wall biosynthesis
VFRISHLIAGDGTDRPRLEEKIQAPRLQDRVVFAGRIAEDEKADHYRLADSFVMPGFGEGFGVVYLEAMACGIPVVASKADASREAVLDGKLGIVVDPRNGEELKAGILEALNRARGVVPPGLEHFSFENFERRLHALLEPFRRA